MIMSRARSLIIGYIALLDLGATARAQQVSSPASSMLTPTAWIQLRAGVDNAGRARGTLNVTWQFKAERPVRGIAVAQHIVVLGTESSDADAAPDAFKPDQRGLLIALNAGNGKMLWSRSVPSWIHGDPIVYRNRIFVGYGRWPMTHPGGVMAVDVATGKTIWVLATNSGVMPAPALDSTAGVLYVAGGDGVLYRVSTSTGKIQSAIGLRSADAMSSPRIDETRTVFVSSGETLHSFSATGDIANWTYRPGAMRALGDIPVAIGDTVVLTTGTHSIRFWAAARALPRLPFIAMVREAWKTRPMKSYRSWFQEQWLLALDRRTGRLLWERSLGIGLAVPRNTSGTPVLSGSRAIVSSPISRTLRAFDAATGAARWVDSLPAIHKGAVTIVDGDIVFGDKSGTISVVRLADGKRVGRCNGGSGFSATAPVIVGETFLAATRDGWVHAIPYATLRARASSSSATSCYGDSPRRENRLADIRSER